MRLEGKVALITGGAGRIGGATATLFAEEGARIVIADVDDAGAEHMVGVIRAAGGDAARVHADVEHEEDIREMVNFAIDRYGKLDVMMNNALYSKRGSVVDLERADWDKGINVMLRSIYLGGKYAIPRMIEAGGGSIINTASIHGLMAAVGHTVYESAKAAVINLSREIAVSFGPQGIRCNAICPGHTVPEEVALRWARVPGLSDQEVVKRERELSYYPLRRLARPIDIAYGALYLACDESAFVTGTALVIDGGLTSWLPGVYD
jgi:NAD(P)-dependent dehydrogenase (short-subunit alcohol dehydrogenase family)